MGTRIQVTIITIAGSALLIGALSCSSGSQSGKVNGPESSAISGLSTGASRELIVLNEYLNSSRQYALTEDDLSALQSAGVLDSGDDSALQPLIKK